MEGCGVSWPFHILLLVGDHHALLRDNYQVDTYFVNIPPPVLYGRAEGGAPICDAVKAPHRRVTRGLTP